MIKPFTIEIKEFGPIRNSEIAVSPLTIFTGESGLGKSYAAFLCHYVYKVLTSNRILAYFKDRGIDLIEQWNQTSDGETFITLNVPDIVSWMEKDAINYVGWLVGNLNMTGSIKFHLPLDIEEIPLKRSEELVGIQNKEEVYWRISYEDFGFNIPANKDFLLEIYFSMFFCAILARLMSPHSRSIPLNDSILLPPSRGSLMDAVGRPNFRAGMYSEFLDMKEQLFSSLYAKSIPDEVLSQIASKSIKGNLTTENNEVIYNTSDNLHIPLSAAASSVKELAPYWLWLTSARVLGCAVLFEEPEAHLHPSRQEAVADTFSYVLNMDSALTITTHSDYLLKRINQLGRLYKLYKSPGLREKAMNIMSEYEINWRSLIDFDKVAAYILKVNEDGTSRIERIDTEDGIPFESFDKVIDAEMTLDDRLAELM